MYFVVTNEAEIASVLEHLDFRPQLQGNPCWCAGNPWVDWYEGDRLLAVGYWKLGGLLWGDMTFAWLTPDSRKWFETWFEQHGFRWDSQTDKFESVRRLRARKGIDSIVGSLPRTHLRSSISSSSTWKRPYSTLIGV